MPSLARKKSPSVPHLVLTPGKVLPVPVEEEGYDIPMNEAGWKEYFRLMARWEKGTYTGVRRIFQTANKHGTTWIGFIYLYRKGGPQPMQIETIIRAPSPEMKRAFRNEHNDRLEPLLHISSFIP